MYIVHSVQCAFKFLTIRTEGNMEPIIDEEETFGVEIEGVISGGGGGEPCYGENCDCYGECDGWCVCDERRVEMRNENERSVGEGNNVLYNESEIDNYECDYCEGECD